MFCPNCGKEIAENAAVCVHCGHAIQQSQPNFAKGGTSYVEDKPNLGINIISLCCIPILGIIMYFVWKDEKPKAAKSALIFGLVGIGVVVLWYVVFFVFGAIASFTNA